MDEEFVADLWMMFKEYLDKKHIDAAAEKYVDMLADYGIDDIKLKSILGTEKNLDDAIQYYLELDDGGSHDDEDDLGWED